MKKTVALILIFVMIFSISGCKRADFEDTAEPFDTIDEGTSANEEAPENQDSQSENINQQSEKQDSESPQKEKQEKGEFFPYTTDDYFRPYEVIVTFTTQETNKNKIYTVEDFPNLSLASVFEIYEFEYNPQGQDKKTVFLMLSQPSKQTVLDYIEILKQDERVYCATPNLHPVVTNSFLVTIDTHSISNVTKESFFNLNIISIEPYKTDKKDTFIFNIDVNGKTKAECEQEIMKQVYKAKETNGIVLAKPWYKKLVNNYVVVKLKDDEISKNKIYGNEDFKGVSIEKIEKIIRNNEWEGEMIIYLKNNNDYKLSEAIKIFLQNSLVQEAYVDGYDYVHTN